MVIVERKNIPWGEWEKKIHFRNLSEAKANKENDTNTGQ